MATEPGALQTWRLRGQSINPADWAAVLHAGVHVQFVACATESEEVALGLLQLFNDDPACSLQELYAAVVHRPDAMTGVLPQDARRQFDQEGR